MSSLNVTQRLDGMRQVSNLRGSDPQDSKHSSFLHTGSVNAATESSLQHPLESSEIFRPERRAIAKVKLARDLCGNAAAQSLKMDIARLNDPGLYRLPIPDLGPPSSQGLDVLLGNDETVHLSDAFNRKEIAKDVNLIPTATESNANLQLENSF